MGITVMNTKAKESKACQKIQEDNAMRLFDIVFALAAITITLPLMALVAIFIKLDSKGPVIFKQAREGKDGATFNILKFRSMKVHDEQSQFLTQAKKNDSRVTRVGRIIRKTSIDELPQFFNVVMGDMSVVGPRPHAVSHNRFYEKKIKGYSKRAFVKPGITGLAQIKGLRGETETIEQMIKRVEMDLEYVEKKSLVYDVVIIIKTPFCIFSKSAY